MKHTPAYSYETLLDGMTQATADGANISIDQMCDAFELWATPIGYLGKITELAFGDIDAKCADIKKNRD